MVRAKFKVSDIGFTVGNRYVKSPDGKTVKDERGYDKTEPCKLATIVMHPVYHNGDPNHENTKFWQASPGGELKLNCVNGSAVKEFNIGQEFYVDFTPAGPAPSLE